MTATVNTMASASSGRWSMPQSAMLPARLAGATRSNPVAESFQIAQATAACQAMSTAPMPVAPHRGSRTAWAITPAPTNSAPMIAPKIAQLAAQAARDPGSSVATSWPTIAPTRPKLNIIERKRCQIGVKSTSRRDSGASSTWRMSATSTEIGPPSAPLRRPIATASTTAMPRIDGALAKSWSMSTSSSINPSMASDTTTTSVSPANANR